MANCQYRYSGGVDLLASGFRPRYRELEKIEERCWCWGWIDVLVSPQGGPKMRLVQLTPEFSTLRRESGVFDPL